MKAHLNLLQQFNPIQFIPYSVERQGDHMKL